MSRKNQMPDWLQVILQEFSRPPYFLQEGLEKYKDAWEQGKSGLGSTKSSPNGSGFDFKSGLGSSLSSPFGTGGKQGFRAHPGTTSGTNADKEYQAGTHRDTPRDTSSSSASSSSGKSSSTHSSRSTSPSRETGAGGASTKGSGSRDTVTASTRSGASSSRRTSTNDRTRNHSEDEGARRLNAKTKNKRKDDIVESADIVNTATMQPNLKDDKAGPSSNWGLVFRKAGMPVEVVKDYSWTVKRAAPKDGAVRVFTPKSTFALKSSYLSPARIEFLHQALTYTEEQGFTRFAPFVLTKEGRPYAVSKDKIYYATKWQTGQPVNFSSEEQVAKVAQVLAEFHEKSRGFESESYNPPMEFDVGGLLRRRTENLKGLLARAEMKREKDRFDQVFTSIANELREQAEQSVRLLDDPGLASFLQTDEEVPGLCHLDVIPSNFIFTPSQTVVAIDFDLCTYAPRALDLSHLLRRALQKQNWRTAVAYQCFVAYNDVRPISGNEYALVQALLTFPYRAWRIANTRLRVGPAPGQVEEIEESVEEFGRRRDFLESFARQISRDA